MQEDIEVKLHEAYEKLIEYPRKVQEIFNDFYGEERVDLQGIPSYDDFKEDIEVTNVASIVRRHGSELLRTASVEAKPIIESLRKEEGTVFFTENPTLITYVLPECIGLLRKLMDYNLFILVYFPFVRVTNEHDRYVDIQDLYAKIPISIKGEAKGSFFLNRSTYPVTHLRADYMHSHCPGLNLDDLSQFKSVCVGSGPIRSTIASLGGEFDSDLWQLFCLELEKFTKVESLSGVPYRRLEEIGRNATMLSIDMNFNSAFRYAITVPTNEDYTGFIKWIIRRKVLKFNLCPTGFALAHTYYDVMLKLSNEFIKYWNTKIAAHTTCCSLEHMIACKILRRYVFKDGKLYKYTGNAGLGYDRYEGAAMFTFKGKEVRFHVIPESDNDEPNNEVLWLSDALAQNVLKVILEILNYNYGREERGEEGAASTGKGRCYI